VKAIWNILADKGLRSTMVGWWASYLAEDIGEGIVVSDALGSRVILRADRRPEA
jgi:hypothetical protein